MKILVDNETSFTLTKNPESQNQIKQINIINHNIYDLIEGRKLAIKLVSSLNMLINGLTKALLIAFFKKH